MAREIDRLADADEARPGDVAVFYRTNAQSRVFEEVFIRVGLPYKVVGGVRFYERKEVRDALAYLRAIANDDDTVSIRRILNTPRRGIGDRAEACVEALSSRDRISFGAALRRAGEAPGHLHPGGQRASPTSWRCSTSCARWPRPAPPEEVLEAVLQPLRLPRPSWRRASTRRTQGRVENLQELVSVAREYTERVEAQPARRASGPRLAGFLEQVALVADADQIPSDDPDHQGVVTLMTLHTAKGLEFPVVFLTGLEDGVFPHLRSLGDTTRAGGGAPAGLRRHHPGPAAALPVPGGDPLGLGAAAYNPPSRFLEELPTGAGPLGAHRGGVHHRGPAAAAASAAAADRAPGARRRFAGGTPKAAQLAQPARRRRQSKLTTASELPQRCRRWRPATGSTTSGTGWAGCSPSRATARGPRPRSTSATR